MAEVNDNSGSQKSVGGTSVGKIFIGQFNSENDPLNGVSITGSDKPATVGDVEKLVEEVRQSFSDYIEIQRTYIDSDKETEKNEQSNDNDEVQSKDTVSSENKTVQEKDNKSVSYETVSELIESINDKNKVKNEEKEDVTNNTEETKIKELTLRNDYDIISTEKTFSEKENYDISSFQENNASEAIDSSLTNVNEIYEKLNEVTEKEDEENQFSKKSEENVESTNKNDLISISKIDENDNFKNEEKNVETIIQSDDIKTNFSTPENETTEIDVSKNVNSENAIIEDFKDNSTLSSQENVVTVEKPQNIVKNDEETDKNKDEEDEDYVTVHDITRDEFEDMVTPYTSEYKNDVTENNGQTTIREGNAPIVSSTNVTDNTTNSITNNVTENTTTTDVNTSIISNDSNYVEVEGRSKKIDFLSDLSDDDFNEILAGNATVDDNGILKFLKQPSDKNTEITNDSNSVQNISKKVTQEEADEKNKEIVDKKELQGKTGHDDNIIGILNDIKQTLSETCDKIDSGMSSLNDKIDNIKFPEQKTEVNNIVKEKQEQFNSDRIS